MSDSDNNKHDVEKTRLAPKNNETQRGDSQDETIIADSGKTRLYLPDTRHIQSKISEDQYSDQQSLLHRPDSDVTRYQHPENLQDGDKTRISPVIPSMEKTVIASAQKPDAGMAISSNFVLKKRFLMEKVLGVGGMGVVYRAKDKLKVEAQDKDPYVAIKVLSDEFKTHPEAFIALQRESRKTQRLSHPNIVKVFDFDKDNDSDVFFMTMEHMEGKPLDRLIKQYSATGLPKDDVWSIIQGMCSALSYAHAEKIVHADFKPGNVFVTTTGMAKVFDFGIARAVTHIDNVEDGHIDKTVFDAGNLGALTPAYASYEMLKGEEPDVRDDVYALGCIAYELLTGVHPFGKIPADQVKDKNLKPKKIKDITKRQWKVIEKSLAIERKDRISTVDEFYRQLTFKPKPRLFFFLSLTLMAIASAGSYLYLQKEPVVEEPIEISEHDIRNEIEYKVRLALYKEELGKLLDAPTFTVAWEENVWRQYSGVSEMLSQDDVWLISVREKIYSFYLDKIRDEISLSRFSRAQTLIQNAYRYTDDISVLNEEGNRLAEAIKDKQRKDWLISQNKKQQKIEAEKQQRETQRIIDEYNLALSNVNRQLECRARLNMRDFDVAIKKLKSLDAAKYAKAEQGIITSLATCISQVADRFPERAAESKKYALRIFEDNALIAAIKITPRDTCDGSIAGLGNRGARATCSDNIKGLGEGPELVVVPTGKGITSFAISKYEISIAEFNRYCKQTNRCSLSDTTNGAFPITNQSISSAKGYVRWLTELTGKKYRLPTKDEWIYAATSATLVQDPNRNCQFSSRGIQKGDDLVKVTIGKQNGWGLVNYLGNVQEWVYEKSGKIVAIGGSYTDSMEDCHISSWQYHSGQPDGVTGFRIVRELTVK